VLLYLLCCITVSHPVRYFYGGAILLRFHCIALMSLGDDDVTLLCSARVDSCGSCCCCLLIIRLHHRSSSSPTLCLCSYHFCIHLPLLFIFRASGGCWCIVFLFPTQRRRTVTASASVALTGFSSPSPCLCCAVLCCTVLYGSHLFPRLYLYPHPVSTGCHGARRRIRIASRINPCPLSPCAVL